MSTAKSLFIRRESDVWESLRSQWAAHTEANERLAQRSAKVVDRRLLCDELKSEAAAARTEAASARTEASSAREQVASQVREMQQRQQELDQITSERDQFRSQTAEAVSRAEALRGQLTEVTERLAEATARAGTLAEVLSVAVGSAWSTQTMASQRRARAEGMFCLLCDFVLASSFSSCLKNIVRLSSGFEAALDESVRNCKALA
jgi:septal ring factor EnvC (AmiA/AmiB activator)